MTWPSSPSLLLNSALHSSPKPVSAVRLTSPSLPAGVCGLQLLSALRRDAGAPLTPLLQRDDLAARGDRVRAATGPTLGVYQGQVKACSQHLLTA